jgi:predicted nucleotidyltransferase
LHGGDIDMQDKQLIENAEVLEVVNVILGSVQVLEIYIFGSFATGTATVDSDIDFYVVIPDDSIRAREATWKIRENLIGKQMRGLDLLVGSRSKFDKNKYTYSIENEVLRTGIKLYG